MTKQNKQLTHMYLAFQEAAQRMEMARQTFTGAEREVFANQSRFYGALELAADGPCQWQYNPDDGVTFTPEPVAKEIETPVQVVESTPARKRGPNGARVKE
jgi:hypothetical protein